VVLADRALVVVFQVKPAQVLFPINMDKRQVGGGAIQVFGFKKSIVVIMPRMTMLAVYDLVTSAWSQLPQNPLQPLPPGCELWYGITVNLRLPE
jgi:hypothetical protein